MNSEGSITYWIGGLKAGDGDAAQKIWECYFDRLVRLARDRLRSVGRRGADQDEEDVALSALNSLCLGAVAGKFPRLEDREGLWGLLVVIAARKAINCARSQRRQKRGGGLTRAETDLAGAGADEDAMLAQVVGREPTPEFAAVVAESLRQRLDALADDTLRKVAVLRLEGHSNEEIAEALGCTTRTVIRKVEVIRRHWSESATDDGEA